MKVVSPWKSTFLRTMYYFHTVMLNFLCRLTTGWNVTIHRAEQIVFTLKGIKNSQVLEYKRSNTCSILQFVKWLAAKHFVGIIWIWHLLILYSETAVVRVGNSNCCAKQPQISGIELQREREKGGIFPERKAKFNLKPLVIISPKSLQMIKINLKKLSKL